MIEQSNNPNKELISSPRKSYSLREESFGFTFFDKSKLSYKFLRKDDLEPLLKERNIDLHDCDILTIGGNSIRKDILFSPIRIYYETTLKCNLFCKNCYNNSGKPRRNELTTEELLQSLHDIRSANVLDLRFTGGELTTRPDWFEILKTAKILGFAVSCNTNGVYSDPSVPDKFAELDLDQVTLSIDGTKDHHEWNRGRNSFDRTLSSLKMMKALGVKLRINTLITKVSLKDLAFMVELANEYTSEINFFITRFVGRGENLSTEELVSFEEFYQMSLEAEKLRPLYPNLNIIHFEGATINNSSRGGHFEDFGLRTGAPDGTTRFNILSNGDLYAGGYIPYIDGSLKLGNVKEDNLVDVWQHSQKLEKFRNSSGKLEAHCGNCDQITTKCPGPNYELELFRKIHPGVQNPYCYYGEKQSLLEVIEQPS